MLLKILSPALTPTETRPCISTGHYLSPQPWSWPLRSSFCYRWVPPQMLQSPPPRVSSMSLFHGCCRHTAVLVLMLGLLTWPSSACPVTPPLQHVLHGNTRFTFINTCGFCPHRIKSSVIHCCFSEVSPRIQNLHIDSSQPPHYYFLITP